MAKYQLKLRTGKNILPKRDVYKNKAGCLILDSPFMNLIQKIIPVC